MQCPKCGQANPEGAKFCRQCGAPFTAEIKCPQCASANLPGSKFCNQCGLRLDATPTPANVGATRRSPLQAPAAHPEPVEGRAAAPAHPTSFASGRYVVKRFLGEGGKKKVYLAHDTVLDRDVAFALIKTEGLDETAKARIVREAQAMGRLGDHPHIMPIYDLGVEYSPSPRQVERGPGGEAKSDGQPFMVLPLMSGGDVEGVVKKAPEHRMPLAQALKIALETCQGLEFAHGKGIVHRDIKPGNVWLTADGVAKIGDFGLALPMDHSRMTREGLMVGTVAYMPPEQATGGEITPRSDLYSLGAMLYEMVTGRPPFIGDDTVAVIGQHLNTPPVSPAWHRPDLPPALGVLIMRLLEKDPARRPASAKEVREALQAVNLAVPSSPNVGATRRVAPTDQPTGNPIYRRAFVGREAELKQLHAAFDAALSGQGGLVMVVGEPGIGKTALTEQLATYAALRGGKALVGHAYEEGSLSLPYLAFVEALRTYVLDHKPEELRRELGTGAADVARIISEVRDRVQVELRPSGDPEDDRYRLLQAVTGFLRNASAVQPLLIVLEDLHWADKGTLDLLLHVARNLQGARLLLIGTYRDVEVDRQHPLSGTLAELRRGATFSRVLLRGLTVDEVHRMISAIAGQEVTRTLAEAIHRQTEGNPLFIQEVLRYLVEEGLVQREGGRWRAATTESLAQRIPEGLRDVIGKRLSRLSPEANRVLAVAAVIGRDFRLDTLQIVLGGPNPLSPFPAGKGVAPPPPSGEGAGGRGPAGGGMMPPPSGGGLTDDALLAALEEAVHVGVLQDQSRGGVAGFRFAHAFFRQTLYEEMFAPRRIRLHQQVGRALESVYARRLEEHAAELAEHFAQSTEREDLGKALRYAELAAKRAMAVYAYGEAARHLERALQVQDVLDPDDPSTGSGQAKARRCDLLLALGEALMPAGEPKRVADETAEEALALAEALPDTLRAARASRLALVALRRYGGPAVVNTPAFRVWTERADRYAPPGSVERVYADTARGQRQYVAEGVWDKAWELIHGALELARKLGDPSAGSGGDQEALFHAAFFAIVPPQAPVRQADRLRLADEFAQRSRDGVSAREVGRVLYACGVVFLTWGQRRRAEEVWQQVQALAERTREPELLLNALQREGRLAVVDGHLEAALEAAERAAALGVELGAPVLGQGFGETVAYRALLHLGRTGEALQGIGRARQMAGTEGEEDIVIGRRALALAHLGRQDEARAALGAFLRERRVQSEDDGRISFPSLVHALEAAVLLNDREAASILAQRLRAVAPLSMGDNTLTCPARHLGAAAALLGEPVKAHAYLQQALEVCAKIRFRPETALTRLQLAELLLDVADGRAQSVGATGQSPLQTPPPPSGEGAGGEVAVPNDAAFAAKLAAAREALSRPPDALRHEANQHLDFAIAEFRAMKMQPSLERALRHRGLLKA